MVISAAERLRQIFREPEQEIDLGRAALALARLEYPDLDEDSYIERLSEFA